MQPRRRTHLPPWERRNANARLANGRIKRRWPRAYDGGGEDPDGPAEHNRRRTDVGRRLRNHERTRESDRRRTDSGALAGTPRSRRTDPGAPREEPTPAPGSPPEVEPRREPGPERGEERVTRPAPPEVTPDEPATEPAHDPDERGERLAASPEARRSDRRGGDRRRGDRRRSNRSRSALDTFRRAPVRNGLIGLAVAGVAAPIGVNKFQQALRNDPAKEQQVAAGTGERLDENSLNEEWAAMEGERQAVEGDREQVISSKLQENSEFNLSRQMAEDIYDMAIAQGVDPDVAFGLVRAESSFKNTSTSYVGAVGLTQLMPATARGLEQGITVNELRDQKTNLRIGFKYLKQLIEKYEGNEDLALTAYNRGPGTVDRVLKRGGDPDNGYANFVRTGDVGSHQL